MNLQKNHPESTDQIAAKQAEIVGLWEGVKHKVGTQRVKRFFLLDQAAFFFVGFQAWHKVGRCLEISKISCRSAVSGRDLK